MSFFSFLFSGFFRFSSENFHTKKLLTGAEGRGLSRPGLGLLDHVEPFSERDDPLLLDRRGLLETIL